MTSEHKQSNVLSAITTPSRQRVDGTRSTATDISKNVRVYVYTPPPGRTWFQRVRDIQLATGFTIKQLARISGIERQTIKRLLTTRHRGIRGSYRATYYPALTTIRRIRKLESIYSKELYAYQQCNLLRRATHRYTTQTVWIEGAGWQERTVQVKRTKPMFGPLKPPGRAADTRAMVGSTGTDSVGGQKRPNPRVLIALASGRERLQRKHQLSRANKYASEFASGVCVEIVESQSYMETDTEVQVGLGDDDGTGAGGDCTDVKPCAETVTAVIETNWEL